MERTGVEALERRSVKASDHSQTSTHLRVYASTLLLFLAGCGIGTERKTPAELQAERLQQEKASLTGDVQQCQTEIAQLRSQIRALSILPKDQSNPYELATLRIARISNFFDKNHDGKQNTLVVYVEPIDTDGDIVKAAGTVTVQLWNLNKPGSEALLGEWKVEPAQLRKLWFDSFATTGYRLTFERPDSVGVFSEPLTIRVTFIDYLTGESFRAQQVIEPRVD